MARVRITPATLTVALLLVGCGGDAGTDDAERDLSLAPAESVAALDDSPQPPPAEEQAAPQERPTTTPTPPPPPERATLPEGTVLELTANDTISSATHENGAAVTATSAADITDGSGRVLIPAGAVFEGVIEDIREIEAPGGEGTLVLAFNRVSFGGRTYTMEARSDSLGVESQGRGITAGDAAKVGVGAAAGAIAGRILGKDTEAAVVGGVVGAAAGAGIAVATKDSDVVLPAGGLIRLVLAAPMEMEVMR
jgi:hypothetical protein